jgi:hypothetical protein
VTSDDAGTIRASERSEWASTIRVLGARSKQNEPVRAAIPFKEGEATNSHNLGVVPNDAGIEEPYPELPMRKGK